MALPLLTANGRKLILKMAGLPRGWLTAATLAESIGVSRRTVLRELPGVEEWMRAAGFAFRRSPGQGILLDEGEERRTALRRLASDGGELDALPREERRQRLLGALLAADGPLKSGPLAGDLLVSEHTLAADLTWAQEWLRPYGIELCRRPGVGVWLQGPPAALRRASGALLTVGLTPEQLRRCLQKGETPAGPAALLDGAAAARVWELLRDFEQQEGLRFTDAGFLSLAIHCTLTVQQMRAGRWQPGESSRPACLRLASRLAARLEAAFALPLPPAEVRYLALYLEAYGGRTGQADPLAAGEMELHSLARALIDGVERAMGVDLSRYPNLAEDLCCHLRPMLYRMEQGAPVENPQLELIKTQYAPLWQATRAACDAAAAPLGRPIPDAEAGYLAMHFGAVVEQEELARLRVRVVVVCPYGMASSRFLAAQLLREFPVLHVAESCSMRTLDEAALRRQGIDMVISTVPLELDFPRVCVSPILQEQDRARLQAGIDAVRSAPAARPKQKEAPPPLRYAGRLSAALLELTDTLTIQTVEIPRNRAGLIEAASRLFCTQPAACHAVEQALYRRETLGDTYIKPLRAVLLHCRTTAVSGCRLGYLRADPPIYEQGQLLLGALVLLAPEGEDPLPVQVVQAVSSLLIEEPRLMEALRAADRPAAVRLLEQGLARHFRQALTQETPPSDPE